MAHFYSSCTTVQWILSYPRFRKGILKPNELYSAQLNKQQWKNTLIEESLFNWGAMYYTDQTHLHTTLQSLHGHYAVHGTCKYHIYIAYMDMQTTQEHQHSLYNTQHVTNQSRKCYWLRGKAYHSSNELNHQLSHMLWTL